MRLESLKAIAEVQTSEQLKNALLRKTVNTKISEVTPGSKIAHWRHQYKSKGKSIKKKGGYVIARFIRADPDGHTAWIQSGNRTLQVDWHQLRPAFGFEQWSPSQEDLKALREAEANIAEGKVSSERGPGPPDDEPLDPDVLSYDHASAEAPVIIPLEEPLGAPLEAPPTPAYAATHVQARESSQLQYL